jgi:hypothetical protein
VDTSPLCARSRDRGLHSVEVAEHADSLTHLLKHYRLEAGVIRLRDAGTDVLSADQIPRILECRRDEGVGRVLQELEGVDVTVPSRVE